MLDGGRTLEEVPKAIRPQVEKILGVTARLGKRKNRREDLLDDYTRVKKERDEYHDKWLASEAKIEELKKELDKK